MKMGRWYGAWTAVLLASLACLALPAAAQKPPPARAQAAAPTPGANTGSETAIGNEGSYALSRAFTYLEDPGGELALADLLKPDAQARFQPVAQSGSATNFGLTSAAIWLRVTLRTAPGAPADWMLELAYPPLDRLELYTPDGKGGFSRQVGGDLSPFADRAVVHRNHVMPVRLKPGAASTLYLRVTSGGTVSAPVKLWQPAALWRHDQAEYATISLYFGLLIGLLLYNLLLFFSVRDRAYLIYVAFVACMAMAQAALTGFGAQFLWPGQLWWNSVSPPTGMAATAVFGLLFARSFLSSALKMPRLDRLIQVLVAGWLLTLLAALTMPYVVSSLMVTVLAVFSVITLVVVGVLSLRSGHPGAKYFLAAWALLLVGVVTLALHNTGLLPSNSLTANSLLIGSALEMVVLSFALADRINVTRREKEQAQARTLAEHAMVEALSVSQENFRTQLKEREMILENSIVGIAFLTPDGRFRWANQAMLKVFGAGSNELTSMEPFYLSREEYIRVGGEVAACVARGENYEAEIQVQQFDGTRIWVSLSGKSVSERDLSQGTVWVIINITRRKELEAQLVRTSSEREAILNSALVGIVLSVNRRHEWVNEKFAQMMGCPREQLIGQPSSYIHPDLATWEQFGREARQTLIDTGSYIAERQLRRRDGTLFWAEMAGSCIQPKDPDSGVIWAFLDITERKKSEADTQEALEQQKALNELRTRFVAMTSHEFRTPLSGILSAEELLRHYGSRLPEQEKLEILDSIAAGVKRMTGMLDRVLLLGKADAQMLEFEPHLLDLQKLCEQLLEEARMQQPDSLCELRLEYSAAPGLGLYDEKLLRHIFGNLLSNAVKYSPLGGLVLFKVREDEGMTVMEVADEGIGIPEEELPHLFESFHRASNVGTIQGTGLGLAIVRNAVDIHGGTIAVQSGAGAGTCFTVRLPARR
ncbi:MULTISPECIES: 7TM diverse intracellular signaling domain-containing protein [unclassified Polaromonas]|uniref:7TM diverse intracellular signaling domain-containing protein n=1 Tax=unclassified Polaromonas TaxID=2638319 RepID=UPI000F09219F|nr:MULTISPECIES: 7TM diverse intracellular signaling domain-containing protein [unclassified Polaromonas]AYQ29873.1 PAS domain S-box protein [Polaromonas sp. SP1]QGJ19012.1 PAS domain S-box protein [Polaromonas sp. Pch-P]